MKLYYSAGSCSTSCHVVLEESGLPYEALCVDWDHPTESHAKEALKLNPLGTLPVLVTDEGKVLSQNVAIQTYVADRAPDRRLLPSVGTVERAEAMNWLSFVAADLHKSFSPLFAVDSMTKDKAAQSEVRKWAHHGVNEYLNYLNQNLEGKDYLMGKNFTVADAYCFVVVGWSKWLEVSLEPYQNVQAYLARVSQRPAVKKVLKDEGLDS